MLLQSLCKVQKYLIILIKEDFDINSLIINTIIHINTMSSNKNL